MDYVVKMDGEKVRSFKDIVLAHAWAKKHCRGEWVIVRLVERDLPKASGRIYPNEELPSVVYKPFMAAQ